MRLAIAAALCSLALTARSAHAQDGDGAAIYRYVDTKGRVVYTNAAEQLPLDKRESARVDLSRVSLNTEVGAEMNRRLEQQHAALTQTSYCKRLIESANAGALERAWDNDPISVLCAGGVLLLLLFSPSMLRRVDAPTWAKTLMFAIPLLAVVGVISFMISHAERTLAAVKSRAEPCMHETFARLSGDKDSLLRRSQLVEQLQQEVSRLEAIGKEGR
jgi:hypothetical protein